MDSIEIYRDASKAVRWRRKAANGNILFSDMQGYSRKIDAMAVILRTQQAPFKIIHPNGDVEIVESGPRTPEAKAVAARVRIAAESPYPQKPRPCPAFMWTGENLQWCWECGHPYWEHDAVARSWGHEQITDDSKAVVKAMWEAHRKEQGDV